MFSPLQLPVGKINSLTGVIITKTAEAASLDDSFLTTVLLSSSMVRQDNQYLGIEHKEKMLAQITHLFERHIKPTQNFLNHSTRLAKGTNLFATMESFKKAFSGNDKHALSSQILRYSMSFSNI